MPKIAHPNTGAIILFARNYAEPEQISELCQQIKATRKGPILIAVDQEGGRVQRFQNGFPALRMPLLNVAASWQASSQSSEKERLPII
jgi:beta-N-acetylhexosaminidase